MRPKSPFSNESQLLGEPRAGVADADMDEETEVLAKEHDSDEVPKTDGSDSDYRPSARQSTCSCRAAAFGRPPRRTSHNKVQYVTVSQTGQRMQRANMCMPVIITPSISCCVPLTCCK